MVSVGNFAKITRTTAKTLRHYDKIGLLTPVVRGENSYRYYSIRQLAMCNAIRVLQKLGVPLAEINSLKDKRTPELAKEVLKNQLEVLDDQRNKLNQAYKLLNTYSNAIQSGLDADEQDITIRFMPAENIIIGETNDYSGEKTDYDALFDFYQLMYDKCLDSEYEMLYPVWGIYSAERIKNEDWTYPDRYYFYNPYGQDTRPAALYAIGYMRTGYGQIAGLCKRMMAFIEQNGFEICGDVYEEYPLNEICVIDDADYLMRLMITVREKHA